MEPNTVSFESYPMIETKGKKMGRPKKNKENKKTTPPKLIKNKSGLCKIKLPM